MDKRDIYAYIYGLFSVICFGGGILFVSKNQIVIVVCFFIASAVLAVLGARKSTHRVDL